MGNFTNRICGIGLPEDNKKTKEEIKVIDLTIGIFFDGTCNNKYNSDNGQKESDSYQGSYTNVAELWEAYEVSAFVEKIYMEGIGTATPILNTKDKEKQEQWEECEIDVDDKDLISSEDDANTCRKKQ